MKFVCYLTALFIFSSCSYNQMVSKAAGPLVESGIASLFQETDAQFAKDAMAGQLKLLEGLLLNDPYNSEYLAYASMGFSAYALGYLEDTEPERAKKIYLRARDYGLRSMRCMSEFKAAENKDVEAFENSLRVFDKKNVPELFWTAISWGLYINLSMDDPKALAQMARVEALMNRVKILDETYFGGGADLFFGVIECVKPIMIGGDPEKGKAHFEKARELSKNDFLLVDAFMAQYYTTATLNEELFDDLCQKVLTQTETVNKKNNLPNALARQKIEYLMSKRDDLF